MTTESGSGPPAPSTAAANVAGPSPKASPSPSPGAAATKSPVATAASDATERGKASPAALPLDATTSASGRAVDAAVGPAVDAAGDSGRKRARAGDKGTVDSGGGEGDDDDDDEPRPFAPLPFYGDHKRAVSSVSFAPTSSGRRGGGGGGGGASWNAAPSGPAGSAAPAMCASASADGTARVWDVAANWTDVPVPIEGGAAPAPAGKRRRSPPAPAAAPHNSAGTAPGTRLNPRLTLVGHNRGINDVAWSPTAAYVATASDDKTLRLWSAETGDAFVEFRGHTNFVFSCRFNPQSNLLVSGSFDETVKLWDIRCGEAVATLPAHSNPVTGVDFNRDGTCIVSGSYDGLIRIWDTATGECLKTVYAEGNPPVGGVRFSPNGRFILSGTLDSKLRLYDVSGGHQPGVSRGDLRGHFAPLRGGRCAKTYAGHANAKYCAFAAFLVANPRRQCVVSGSEDGRVYLYDLQSRLVRQALEGHGDAVLAVDAHDSLELIGSGGMSNDKVVRFWAPIEADS